MFIIRWAYTCSSVNYSSIYKLCMMTLVHIILVNITNFYPNIYIASTLHLYIFFLACCGNMFALNTYPAGVMCIHKDVRFKATSPKYSWLYQTDIW